MRGDDDLAAIVRAYAFALVDVNTGQVVGQLAPGTDPTTGVAGWELEMMHPFALSSFLFWTRDTTPLPVQESMILSGPTGGATQSNRLRLGYTNTGASVSVGGGLDVNNGAGQSASVSTSASAAVGGQVYMVAVGALGTSEIRMLDNAIGFTAPFVDTTAATRASMAAPDVQLNPSTRISLNGRQCYVTVFDVVDGATANTVAPAAGVAIVTGISIALNLLIGDICRVTWFVDADVSVAAAGQACVAQPLVNGAVFGGNRSAIMSMEGVDRATVGNQDVYTVPADGLYTFTLSWGKNGAAGTATARATHTTMRVEVISTN